MSYLILRDFFLIFLLVVKVIKKVQKLDNCQSYPKKNVTPNSFIFMMAVWLLFSCTIVMSDY